MDGWRDRWRVVVASNVDGRDGLGWEVRDPGGGLVWEVFREDGGAFPVLSAVAGAGPLPPRADLEAITREAVADLLTAAGLADPAGWVTHNIAAALLLASVTIETWEGEEWAVERTAEDPAVVFDALLARQGRQQALALRRHLAAATPRDWPDENLPGLTDGWLREIRLVAAGWDEIGAVERFAVLQQVGNTLRTGLCHDVESRLR